MYILTPHVRLQEWSHPTTGNLFSAISICLCIYGIFMYAHDSYFGFGITLVWMGSVMQMALAVLVVVSVFHKGTCMHARGMACMRMHAHARAQLL